MFPRRAPPIGTMSVGNRRVYFNVGIPPDRRVAKMKELPLSRNEQSNRSIPGDITQQDVQCFDSSDLKEYH